MGAGRGVEETAKGVVDDDAAGGDATGKDKDAVEDGVSGSGVPETGRGWAESA